MKYFFCKRASILIVIVMIGFLCVSVILLLHLVLKGGYDNSSVGDKMKAYFGAEAGQELALLKMKDKGYSFFDFMPYSMNNRSVVLGQSFLDDEYFRAEGEVFISYELGVRRQNYVGVLESMNDEMIPPFYHIFSSGQVGKYRKNLNIYVDNNPNVDF